MKKIRLLLLTLSIPLIFLLFDPLTGVAQVPNGQFDDPSELATRFSVPFRMPDGVRLMTDIYLPIPQDCLITTLDIDYGSGVYSSDLKLISKGKQLVIYDSINGGINPNPYKLPIIFVRTPYDKAGGDAAGIVSLFGYAFSYQDQRGRYASEGVYIPLYSDAWNKNPYHDNVKHVLDLTDLSDPKNGNKHEDGYNSIRFLIDSVYRNYDLDNDGITDTVDKMTHEIVGLFGASALGYNQYQAMAAHHNDSIRNAVKCMTPIVCPGEFYKSTGFQNGVLRDRLVTGWIKGQIFTGTEDDSIPYDNDIQNSLHTSFDYGLNNKFDAANEAIDHFVSRRYLKADGSLDVAGYYPNSRSRADMDISRAPVDAAGEGDANGAYNRYKNMEVPTYNISGWWDIFIDGQLETWSYMRKYAKDSLGNRNLQKIVIGPWAHQTIASRTTGDITYPANVMDVVGNIDVTEDDLPISEVLQSEVISWFRYNMNNQPGMALGKPKFILHESDEWQELAPAIEIRLPASNFVISFEKMLEFMNGVGALDDFPVEIRLAVINTQLYDGDITIPALGAPLIDGLDGQPIQPIPYVDFKNDIPNVRFYVVGPNGDGEPANDNVGNYWFSADSFPLLDNISWTRQYMHQNSTLNSSAPATDEGYSIYVHDPDDPIRTIGGANMIVKDPQGDRDSQGQMELTNPLYAPYSLDRPGVVSFETAPIQDSLCIIGFPVANLWAKSNPGGVTNGPTDTDFFVRILDVYPDGREYFVVEGCVNARAREYAKAQVRGSNGMFDYHNKGFPRDEIEDSLDYIPFSNIEIGGLYEYTFRLLPIAYTWGKNHKMKVLISSSNYNRYQVNPNLPIEEGEFFRRKPGDGQTYTYQGEEMSPRVAVQRIAFSGTHQSYIDLPVYSPGTMTSMLEASSLPEIDAFIHPNPATANISVFTSKDGAYELEVYDLQGNKIASRSFQDHIDLSVAEWDAGLYIFRIMNNSGNSIATRKVSVL